jgi:hypothetical protein
MMRYTSDDYEEDIGPLDRTGTLHDEGPPITDTVYEAVTRNETTTNYMGSTSAGNSDEISEFYSPSKNIGPHGRASLVKIAAELSRRRSTITIQPQGSHKLAGIDSYETALDPETSKFDLNKWLHRFFSQLPLERVKSRRTGVAFRNLDVFGSGST